ncbi:MAG: hypothetical protein Q4E16_06000 [Neisseria sp.]|nr:hypothetical protein [Neisseria sp.]
MRTTHARVSLLPMLFVCSILLTPLAAQAGPSGNQDLLPSCDMRALNLTGAQLNEIRKLRTSYKLAKDRALTLERRIDKSRRSTIIRILENSKFDEQMALRYVNERLEPSKNLAVEQLATHQRFYQILNETQQKKWLEMCVQ